MVYRNINLKLRPLTAYWQEKQIVLADNEGIAVKVQDKGRLTGRAVLLCNGDDAVRMLEKRFNVDIVTANSKYKEDAFTGSFTDQRLERILEIFKLSSGINWRYDLSSTNEGEKSKIIIY